MPRILIVEDEPDVAFGLTEDLTRHGYETEVAGDGEQGVQQGCSGRFDLILLDVMLPRIDGFEVCRELRRRRINVPIILLTAKTHESEKVLGLELGADDYITKPFSLRELRARIKARLRQPAAEQPNVVRFGDCVLDFSRAELSRNQKPMELTPTEYRLLKVFVENQGRVLTRQQLIDSVWDRGTFITDRVVDTHVWSLRKKIEDNPSEPRCLHAVRGIGYRFDLLTQP
ncbi:MAG: response regulator transcription factor [Acidobacteria bacterium]|nr:response regulator transcription factor [Acidobacteriota bacterium]